MPKRTYALISQPDQENLEISWDGGVWHVQSNIVVRFEGAIIAQFQNREELRIPQKILVPQHPPIFIYLEGSVFRIRQQGKSVADHMGQSPMGKLKGFYGFSFWLSLLLLIYSSLSIAFLPFPNLSNVLRFYPYTIVPAFLFALLGLVTSKTYDITSLRHIWLVTLSVIASISILLIIHPLIVGEGSSSSSIFLLVFYIIQARESLLSWRELHKMKQQDNLLNMCSTNK